MLKSLEKQEIDRNSSTLQQLLRDDGHLGTNKKLYKKRFGIEMKKE